MWSRNCKSWLWMCQLKYYSSRNNNPASTWYLTLSKVWLPSYFWITIPGRVIRPSLIEILNSILSTDKSNVFKLSVHGPVPNVRGDVWVLRYFLSGSRLRQGGGDSVERNWKFGGKRSVWETSQIQIEHRLFDEQSLMTSRTGGRDLAVLWWNTKSVLYKNTQNRFKIGKFKFLRDILWIFLCYRVVISYLCGWNEKGRQSEKIFVKCRYPSITLGLKGNQSCYTSAYN